MASNGWGTAVKWSGYNRKTQTYNSYSETDIQRTYVTYSVYGCARSGDGSGYYYASDWGVTVTLQYSVDNGATWTTLGSQYGTLDYGANVASITRSVTIYRTTASQNVKFRSKAVTSGINEVAYSDSPTTVYALESYTVGYNLNGASGTAPSNQTKYYSQTLTLRSDTPTRSGYSFLGWATTSSATEAEYAPGASYTANAAATMYAVWSLDYKIPAIGEITAYRCDANGNALEEGTRCHILFGWELDSIASGATLDIVATTISNGQTVTLQCVSGATLSNNPYEAVIQPSGGFDTEKSYNLSVTITDSNGRSGLRTSFLSQSYVPIDCSPEGGVGIGTVAPSGRMLDVGIDTNLDKTITLGSDARTSLLAALGISELFHFEVIVSASASIGEGAIKEFSATAPTVDGMACRGVVQTWYDGSGNPLIGASWRTSSTNVIHARVRANSASTIRVWWLLLYTPHEFTTFGDWPE